MLELFCLKLVDCAMGTAKNIFLYKNRHFLSALTNTVAAGLFFAMVAKIAKDGSWMGIAIICLATFVGTYLPGLLMKHMEKEKIYIFDITPPTTEKGKEFADSMRENNIPVLTYKGYNHHLEEVLCCKIFSQSKDYSKIVESSIPHDFKYHVIETKTYPFN